MDWASHSAEVGGKTTFGVVHSEPYPGVQGLWWIRAACERPKLFESKGAHRDSTSYEHTGAKEPNSDVTGGGKRLNLSKPSLRFPVLAWLSRWKLLKLQEGFFFPMQRWVCQTHIPPPATAVPGALRLMRPSSKAPEDPDFRSFPVPFSGFQQQLKVKLHRR